MLLSIALGIGLSAACGFRVFVPLLALSIASLGGWVPLSGSFEWMGTIPAMVVFATATILEVAAYYIPWFDNLLDAVATPAAVIAGVITSLAVFTEIDPLLKWTLAIIGGGGAAGLIQGATALLRLKSTTLTGGIGNPVIATLEFAVSILTSILSLLVPFVAILAVIFLCWFVFRTAGRLLFGRRFHTPSTHL